MALTSEELLHRGNELSRRLEEIDALKGEAKSAAETFKGQIEERQADVLRLRSAIRSGREHREVQCTWERDDEKLTMALRRLDTSEVVESRPMTAEERQEKLNLRVIEREGAEA